MKELTEKFNATLKKLSTEMPFDSWEQEELISAYSCIANAMEYIKDALYCLDCFKTCFDSAENVRRTDELQMIGDSIYKKFQEVSDSLKTVEECLEQYVE